jgi:hypothetical protein
MKIFLPILYFVLFIVLSVFSFKLLAGDNKNILVSKDPRGDARIKDSLSYLNLQTETATYIFQGDESNAILLPNGLKVSLKGITRLPIPRGVMVTLPDTFSQKFTYELAELEISATNTTAADIKLDGSEPVFVSLRLFSKENSWKSYASQYSLSFGSVYLKMEPQQTEKMNLVYTTSHDFLDMTYKPNQTKVFKGIIVPVPKSVKTFDYLVLYTREFGQNRSYGCKIKLQ